MFRDYKNSKKQGDAGLGAAISYFCMEGVNVSIPLSESQDYDLVAEIDGRLNKVQVRTTRFKKPSGYYVVNLRVCGGNSKSNYIHKKSVDIDYDLLFVLAEDGSKYLLSKEQIAGRDTITLNSNMDEYRV